jgi:hypothetical protein
MMQTCVLFRVCGAFLTEKMLLLQGRRCTIPDILDTWLDRRCDSLTPTGSWLQ